MDDHELLREYVERRSQDAFRELVGRHLRMVYSAAHRMVRDSHLAEEVAQSVFTMLAQRAGSVSPPQIVGGWLYNTTRHLAMHAVRSEQRRREREQTAAAMRSLETNPDARQIAEQLEPVMEKLDAGERDVLVLRYLENRSLREVGAELAISEDAARMRVNRALEQLRSRFAREGVHLTTTILAAALVATTVSAVPSGLSAAIIAAACAGTVTVGTTATHAVLTTMNWINAKSILAILAAAVIAGSSTYRVQQRKIKNLRADNENLAAHQEKLTSEREAALTDAKARNDEVQQLKQDNTELLRLRSEVSQLRQEREEAKRRAQQVSTPKIVPPVTPARPTYVSKDQARHVGYATPEAALQTITWATFNGTPEQMLEGLSPQLLTNAAAYQDFDRGRKQGKPFLKAIQVVAEKTISENEIEMKLRLETEPIPGQPDGAIPMTIFPLVKVGNEWKVGPWTRDYDVNWEQSGKIDLLEQ